MSFELRSNEKTLLLCWAFTAILGAEWMKVLCSLCFHTCQGAIESNSGTSAPSVQFVWGGENTLIRLRADTGALPSEAFIFVRGKSNWNKYCTLWADYVEMHSCQEWCIQTFCICSAVSMHYKLQSVSLVFFVKKLGTGHSTTSSVPCALCDSDIHWHSHLQHRADALPRNTNNNVQYS